MTALSLPPSDTRRAAEANGEDAMAALARDLRRGVGAFVRAVRQDTGTVRSAQSEALELLEQAGPMNVAVLAQRRGVTHQTMRLVAAELVADGLVTQGADPADRRSRLLTLSSAGSAVLASERSARTSRIEEALRRELTEDQRDVLRAALPLLDRLSRSSPQVF